VCAESVNEATRVPVVWMARCLRGWPHMCSAALSKEIFDDVSFQRQSGRVAALDVKPG
jgi:hypothetical protein